MKKFIKSFYVKKFQRERKFTEVLCVKGNKYFRSGCIYPMLGWNNGNHVISEDEYGNVIDLILLNYGNELIDPETESIFLYHIK